MLFPSSRKDNKAEVMDDPAGDRQRAFVEAANALERHPTEGDPASPELLADVLEGCGEFRRALRHGRRAYAARPSVANEQRLARLLVQTGDLPEARRVLASLRSGPGIAEGARGDWARIEASYAELLYQHGQLDDASGCATALLRRRGSADSVPADAALPASQVLAKVALARGDLEAAKAQYRSYAELARQQHDVRHEALALGGLGVAHITAGDLDEAERCLHDGAARAESVHDSKGQTLAWHNLAVVAHLRHDYAAARARYDRALHLLQAVGNRPSQARVAFNLGDLYETLGDLDRAGAMCDLGFQVGGAALPPRAQAEGLLLRGRIALARADHAEAQVAFEASERILAGVDPLRCASAFLGLARAAVLEGAIDRARTWLERVPVGLSASRSADFRIAQAEVARAEGEVPLDLWQQAADFAASADDPGLRLTAWLGLADALASSRPERAAEILGRAEQLEAELSTRVPEDSRACWEHRPLRRRLVELRGRVGGSSRRRPGSSRPPGRSSRAPSVPSRPSGLRHGEFVGRSPQMQYAQELIRRVGPSDCNVLVRGESGTGKELAVRALHAASARRDEPLVCVNCAALVEPLLLSELFGHERGAFTGAQRRKKGRIERAHRGTLFLDEIGDVSPTVQAALLRVLEEREFRRVGGHESIPVDIRVVAATHRDLEAMVESGAFRQDLYYRLKQITLTMPPLRERVGDVEALAAHFLAAGSEECGGVTKRLSESARAQLVAYRWPGNVRQLANVLRAAALLAEGPEIQSTDLKLPDPVRSEVEGPAERVAGVCYDRVRSGELTMRELKREIERGCVHRALQDSDGVIAKAADLLGMKRPRLSQLVKELDLRPKDPTS